MKGYILRLAELARPATTNATANAVMVETSGKILVTGTAQENYLHSDGSGYYQVELAMVQYQSNGALDPTFGSDGVALPFVTSGATSDGYALATLSSGNIAVAGQIEDSSGGHDVFVTDYSVATTPSNVYTYDVRNEMTTATVAGVSTTYVYNDSGDRVSETTSGTTTAYLFNTANPTGYDQEIEEHVNGSSTPSVTYFIGADVYGQATGSTIYYLMRDGHGNTRLITNSGGEVLADYDYDAFSDPLNFNPATAYTTHLTSDGVYDIATTFEYQLARWRNSFEWTQMDTQGHGNNSEPITLNPEIYGDGNPVNNKDRSGHYSGGLAAYAFGLAAEYSLESVAGLIGVESGDGESGSSNPAASVIGSGVEESGSLNELTAAATSFRSHPPSGGIAFPRLPDFYEFSVSLPIGSAIGLPILVYSVGVDLDRYGDVFFSPIGLGLSFPPGGFSFVAGWLNETKSKPSEAQLTSFLSANNFSVGGGFFGGIAESWTPGSGTATKLGFFSPGGGGGWSYSFHLGKLPISW